MAGKMIVQGKGNLHGPDLPEIIFALKRLKKELTVMGPESLRGVGEGHER